MATILENSIKSLKKCYIGIGDDGKHTLDKSKISELEFMFASTQVSIAIKKGLITEEKFIEKVSFKYDLETALAENDRENTGTVDHFPLGPIIFGTFTAAIVVLAILHQKGML